MEDKMNNTPSHEDLGHNITRGLTNGTGITMPPEVFEKLYLSPHNKVKGSLRQTFANPTPIGICGFIIALGPLACSLMGWRGAASPGFSGIPQYIYFGGILMILSSILEFFLGNTFPAVVFSAFGAFWLTFAGTLLPQFNAFAAYAPADAASAAEGLQTTEFNSGFGFYTLSMALLSFVFLICSFRTNIPFVIIFFTLVLALSLITGAYWSLAGGYLENAAYATKLLQASGACLFVTTACGWWIFMALMLASVDFPFSLPIGDLSTRVPGSRKPADCEA
ncbi:unnamed protein product [Parascedosporium putredinis]|uniref:GPR1/FUN34/YaaH-class plasma membrane protein n=1 Tax=Parascedosporium putredinis TaxID=1442378 RepID=A0A9P1M7H4_9PEZI|nr:unnamed protein product [Parascedosporium putredinis]CAI7988347.1 unnamed protein product [Parascedosporium putredinis]